MQEQTAIEKVELKIPTTLKALVEALIFAAHEPLSLIQIRTVYQSESDRDGARQIEVETIRQIVSDLNKDYEENNRPYRIVQIAGGYQYATLPEYAEWLGRLYKEQGRRKLSQSGVETLAIIAYKQPVAKAEIEKIRGVNCDYVLKALLEKELIIVTGRAESVGRPLLYGTTKEFLKHFGLNDITDLPRPREIEEILGESQFETERRMLEAQAGAEQMTKEQEDFKSRLPHIPKKKSGLEEREVEIVPHMNTREIHIVPVENRTTLEETGQEAIVFNSEEAPPARQPEDIPIVPEEFQDNTYNGSAVDDTVQNVIEPKSLIEISEEPEIEIIPEVTEHAQEPLLKTDKEIADGAELSIEKSIIQEAGTHTLPAKSRQPLVRWKIWKEKIQQFIKKLFV